jgi:hypothetical protein
MLIARAGHLENVAGRVTMMQKCKNSSDLGLQEKSDKIQAVSILRPMVTKECDWWKLLCYLRYAKNQNFGRVKSQSLHFFAHEGPFREISPKLPEYTGDNRNGLPMGITG